MTTFGQLDSDELVTLTYDEHGNLRERAATPRGVVRDGTRWENTYEGNPPRLMAQAKGTFTKPSGPTDVSSRTRFRYDEAGHVIEEQNDLPRGPWIRRFTWKGERIVEVQWVVEPRHTKATLPFDGRETFEYDAQGRLVAHVIDGDPRGEGDLADGKPDQRETFHYDAQGLLARIERDGQVGDVAPEAPDETIDAITLLSPRCDAPSRLAPGRFGVPDLSLPASITPRLR
jgi:YD repeat-containing protein